MTGSFCSIYGRHLYVLWQMNTLAAELPTVDPLHTNRYVIRDYYEVEIDVNAPTPLPPSQYNISGDALVGCSPLADITSASYQ